MDGCPTVATPLTLCMFCCRTVFTSNVWVLMMTSVCPVFCCLCSACVVLFCSFAALSAKAERIAHAWCDANGKSTQEAGLLLIIDERLLLDSIAHDLFI